MGFIHVDYDVVDDVGGAVGDDGVKVGNVGEPLGVVLADKR